MADLAQVFEETRTRRAEACALLVALETARSGMSELTDGGAGDVFKGVTGESSIERAVSRTKRLIASFDRVLEELDSGLSAEDIALLAEIEASPVGERVKESR